MNVRITKEKFTSTQTKQIKKMFNEFQIRYNKDAALQVLYILHFDFGFGQQRLHKFADKLAEMQNKTVEYYEMTDQDTPWRCEKELKESGIDVDKILKGDESNG